jgi:hypothetical protein
MRKYYWFIYRRNKDEMVQHAMNGTTKWREMMIWVQLPSDRFKFSMA